MNTRLASPSQVSWKAPSRHRWPRAARLVLRLLSELHTGTLDLQLPDGQRLHCGGSTGLRAAMKVDDWAVFTRVLSAGDIGLAESFIEGQWSSPDLVALLHLFMVNRDAVERAVYGSVWGQLGYRIRHWLHRNSRSGSRKNIHAHYDLGNAFYRLWLDPSMNYSSAWFDGDPSRDLVQAQAAKVGRVLSEAGVQRGSRVLEIGCGWGALAEQATRDLQAHVTGVTLSSEQLSWAQQRMATAGRADQVDLRLQDYRDITRAPGFEPFDAVVSVEMFEAVGQAYWPGFFETVRDCLKPGGQACIQSITIRDDLFDRYVRSTDFIQQYVFPGGMLPSVSVFQAQALRAGLTVERCLPFGADYAETLRRWRERFLACRSEVLAQGFDDRFLRIWEFYLVYCEAAFASGQTDVVQFTLRRAA